VSKSNLQLSQLFEIVLTNGLRNRLSKILFGRLLGDFGFGEEALQKEGDGGEEEF